MHTCCWRGLPRILRNPGKLEFDKGGQYYQETTMALSSSLQSFIVHQHSVDTDIDSTDMAPLQFTTLPSQPTPPFWTALTTLKLDTLKLSDASVPIIGWLDEGREIVDREDSERVVGVEGGLGVGGGAFGADAERPPQASIPLHGILQNYNTIEDFKRTDLKKNAFNALVDSILESYHTPNPNLNPFLVVTFADLKKYGFHYWFASPAFVAKPAWELMDGGFEHAESSLVQSVRDLENSLFDERPVGLCVKLEQGEVVAVAPLAEYTTFFKDVAHDQRIVAFHDPSAQPQHPGWPLRNILHYLSTVHFVTSTKVLCLRAGNASRTGIVSLPAGSNVHEQGRPQAVGWEKNTKGVLASRMADLGPLMDPTKLADQAVDLNLKLMRWRIMPALDLDKIASTKCLLLGAGTLGCYVARGLMGWGIRNITFVDSGKVSFSNPVRQPLFEFEDCLDGGKPKAECAAERLKRVYPGVNAKGLTLSIPMPGHPIPASSTASTEADLRKLEDLVEMHDAVFLLMDSRESRWLPTVLGASKGKMVLNAALGFDTYLVMRHGPPGDGSDKPRLGCYYCNDIVAPADSLTDRTLDQMCTVTRPGIAPIAAATAVELLVSLVQHPDGIHAPAETEAMEETKSPLGPVPHQVRGQLSAWKNLVIEGRGYERCTGCSNTVVEAYRTQGHPFLLRAFNEPDFLEKLTGLDKLYEEGEAVLDSIDWEEGDSEEGF